MPATALPTCAHPSPALQATTPPLAALPCSPPPAATACPASCWTCRAAHGATSSPPSPGSRPPARPTPPPCCSRWAVPGRPMPRLSRCRCSRGAASDAGWRCGPAHPFVPVHWSTLALPGPAGAVRRRLGLLGLLGHLAPGQLCRQGPGVSCRACQPAQHRLGHCGGLECWAPASERPEPAGRGCWPRLPGGMFLSLLLKHAFPPSDHPTPPPRLQLRPPERLQCRSPLLRGRRLLAAAGGGEERPHPHLVLQQGPGRWASQEGSQCLRGHWPDRDTRRRTRPEPAAQAA